MVTLLLALTLSAEPNVRVRYEQKCLYCHSEEVAERKKLTEAGWFRLIDKMRLKAPMLITRRDVVVFSRYMVNTLKLTPPVVERPPALAAVAPAPVVEAVAPPKFEIVQVPVEPTAAEADPELERQGFTLMQQRCSKCHTLSRVYGKLDGLERTLTIIERMQLKTGSGITDHDAELLEKYVRGQFAD